MLIFPSASQGCTKDTEDNDKTEEDKTNDDKTDKDDIDDSKREYHKLWSITISLLYNVKSLFYATVPLPINCTLKIIYFYKAFTSGAVGRSGHRAV